MWTAIGWLMIVAGAGVAAFGLAALLAPLALAAAVQYLEDPPAAGRRPMDLVRPEEEDADA